MGSSLVESEVWLKARDRFMVGLSTEEQLIYYNVKLENMSYTAGNAERSNAASTEVKPLSSLDHSIRCCA